MRSHPTHTQFSTWQWPCWAMSEGCLFPSRGCSGSESSPEPLSELSAQANLISPMLWVTTCTCFQGPQSRSCPTKTQGDWLVRVCRSHCLLCAGAGGPAGGGQPRPTNPQSPPPETWQTQGKFQFYSSYCYSQHNTKNISLKTQENEKSGLIGSKQVMYQK